MTKGWTIMVIGTEFTTENSLYSGVIVLKSNVLKSMENCATR
jgi:hypothetical protein